MSMLPIAALLLCVALVLHSSVSFSSHRLSARFHGLTQSLLLHAGKGFDVEKLANQPPEPQEDLSTLNIEELAKNKDVMFQKLRIILRGTCVNFVGMMGCGKSTIGKLFAENIGYRFTPTSFFYSLIIH